MEQRPVMTPRVATVAEAATVARLLDAFNREYDTPTPGPAVLATRLRRLLAGSEVIALARPPSRRPAVPMAMVGQHPRQVTPLTAQDSAPIISEDHT